MLVIIDAQTTLKTYTEDTHIMEDRMLNITQVRDRLGLSAYEVINLVQSGRLRAYRYAGTGPVSRLEVRPDTQALRFRDSDINELLEASLIK